MLDLERIKNTLQAPVAAPLHARLRDAIQAQLMDGTLKPGDIMPPERTLKERLGISRSTIRQAIKSLIDDGLLKSIVGAGTYVLEPQQTPSNNPLIGIIVPDSDYLIYYPELVSSLSFGLRNASYRVDTVIHNDRYETFAQVTTSWLSQGVKAIVVVAPKSGADETIRQLQTEGIIILLLTRYLKNLNEFEYIGVDNQHIGREATQHLINLGHTNILHVAGSNTSTAFDRAIGYVQAMENAGLTPQIFISPDEKGLLPPNLTHHVMEIELSQLWIRITQKEITGVFCFNDNVASWVQKEMRRYNLLIPRDLSLISVDNMPYADFFDTPLTTFSLPGNEIGNKAAELLLQRLDGDTSTAQRILLPARLIHRLSTAAPQQNITSLSS